MVKIMENPIKMGFGGTTILGNTQMLDFFRWVFFPYLTQPMANRLKLLGDYIGLIGKKQFELMVWVGVFFWLEGYISPYHLLTRTRIIH